MTLEQRSGTEGGPASRITTDTLPYDFVGGIQQRFSDRVFDPNTDSSASEKLLAKREVWRQMGVTTIFTTGLFDLLHLDHMGYLLHTKLAGAAVRYEALTAHSWDDLSPEERISYTKHCLSQQSLRLVVSVDGNKSAEAKKAFNPEKGGGPRPILSWRTRALMVAGQSVVDPLDTEGSLLIPTVDAVTAHGPADFDQTSPHRSHPELAAFLQPDAWVFFGESQDIIETVPGRPDLANVALRCIEDGTGTHYFEDDIIGKMSTTKIAQRVRGIDATRV